MALRIERIAFRDFRNYEEMSLGGLGALTILVGPNAVGKSNIVEGVQLLTAGTSFRHATVEQMVRRGAPGARLEMLAADGVRSLEVGLSLSDRARRYSLNGKPKRPADLRGLVPSVAFTPDDLELVKGPMSVRRGALDALGSQINANYHTIRKDYEKVVRHKSALLKEEASPVSLASVDKMLVTCGAQLTCYRAALFSRLAGHLKRGYEDISGGRESFESGYAPSCFGLSGEDAPSGAFPYPRELERDRVREAMERALFERRAEEVARRRCLVGPHVDGVDFLIDGMSATRFGSQGQQRSVVLAYKLAEAAVIEEILGQKPVMLLDDVMSELDGSRREALVSYVSSEVQTFVTTANLAYFNAEMLSRADVIHLPL